MSGATDALLASAPGIPHWRTAAVLLTLRWPLLLIMIAQTALHVMNSLKLAPTRTRAALSLGIRTAALLILLVLLRRWPPFEVVNAPPGEIMSVTRGLHIGLGIAWGIITVTLVGGILFDLGRLGRRSVRSLA